MTAVDEWDDVTVVDDFRRDRWDRPLILQPDGTRIDYTRSSTAAKTIEDTYNLERWDKRGIAYGMAYDSSLVARLIALGGNPATWDKATKDQVHQILDDARACAQAHKGADIGTALHHLTHRLDRGEAVDAGPYTDDLRAYATTLPAHGLKIDRDYIECRIVNDLLRMAGSADRIVKVVIHEGRTSRVAWRIADIKTGATVDFGALGWSAQLAAYAGGVLYDVVTEQRLATPPIDQTTGYIIHLPAGQGHCDIYEIDLVAGHRAAELANQIRQIRKQAKGWLQPKSTWTVAPAPPPGLVERPSAGGTAVSPADTIPAAAADGSPSSVARPAPTPSAGVGAPNATPHTDKTAQRREGLLARYHALSELDRKRFDTHMASRDRSDLDLVEQVLWGIEATANRSHQRNGWDDDDTNTDPQQWTPPPDEGDLAADDAIAALKFNYNNLTAQAQTWVATLVAEGHAASVPWSTGTLHSERRYQLGRAIVALAGSTYSDLDDIVRGLIEETIGFITDLPLGVAIGHLDATEATRFATYVDNYLDGTT